MRIDNISSKIEKRRCQVMLTLHDERLYEKTRIGTKITVVLQNRLAGNDETIAPESFQTFIAHMEMSNQHL